MRGTESTNIQTTNTNTWLKNKQNIIKNIYIYPQTTTKHLQINLISIGLLFLLKYLKSSKATGNTETTDKAVTTINNENMFFSPK